MGAGDEMGRLRARLEAGDWRALVEPAGEGLLTLALLSDPAWPWREAWAACLAELLRPWWRRTKAQRFGRRVEETTAQALASPAQLEEDDLEERRRQRWRLALDPGYWFENACAAQLRTVTDDRVVALAVLGRWLP